MGALDFDFFKSKVEPIFLKQAWSRAMLQLPQSAGQAVYLEPMSPGSTH